MFEKILLVLILILQAVFTGLIFSGKEGIFNWEAFTSLFQSFVLVVSFFVGYFLLKKETIFNRKLQVHEKLTSILVNGLHRSFYDISPYIMNSYAIEKSNPKIKDDYFTKQISENSRELIKKIPKLQSDFQSFYEFFQLWKALFSKKVDFESKFIFDLETILGEDLWNYQNKLSDYSILSLMKDDAEIKKNKEELLQIEKRISIKTNTLANGLDKFVSDMSREVFQGLFTNKKNEENRLFSPEMENSNDGDPRIYLTDKGFIYKLYQKTGFQNEFGGFRQRKESLRNFLEKDIS